ncbi:MAG: hypothetical protein RH862_12010 [Leptospiraceae bacterium]
MKTRRQRFIFHFLLGGLAVWAVPFLVSLPFFSKTGQLQIDIFAFKTIMILVSSFVGLWILSAVLPAIQSAQYGMQIGATWMVLNWALDYLILLPLNDMTIQEYLFSTGLRYLHIPLSGYFMGVAMMRRGAILSDQ